MPLSHCEARVDTSTRCVQAPSGNSGKTISLISSSFLVRPHTVSAEFQSHFRGNGSRLPRVQKYAGSPLQLAAGGLSLCHDQASSVEVVCLSVERSRGRVVRQLPPLCVRIGSRAWRLERVHLIHEKSDDAEKQKHSAPDIDLDLVPDPPSHSKSRIHDQAITSL